MVDKNKTRIGHTHFPMEPQTVLANNSTYVKKKKRHQTCLFMFYTVLLILICIGFIGFSYYLYERQNTEIELFLDKFAYLKSEMEQLRKKVENLSAVKPNSSNGNIQSMLQESESSKFQSIAVSVENGDEEFGETENQEENLNDNEEYDDDYTVYDPILDESKNEKTFDMAYNNHPPNPSLIGLSNRTELSSEEEVGLERSVVTTNSTVQNTINDELKQLKKDVTQEKSINKIDVTEITDNRNANRIHIPLPTTISTESTNIFSNVFPANIDNQTRPVMPNLQLRKRRSADIFSTSDNLNNNPYSKETPANKNVARKSSGSDNTMLKENPPLFNNNNNGHSNKGKNKLKESTPSAKTMITMPLEDFINDFSKNQEKPTKANENCSLLFVNRGYNFNVKYSDEEDDDDSLDSLLRVTSGLQIDRNLNISDSSQAMRRKIQGNRSSRMRGSNWKKQVDIEVLSDDNSEASHMVPRQTSSIAAHFGGDTSKYSMNNLYYQGNGRLRHPTGEHKDWLPTNWFQELRMDQHFTLKDGNLTVRSSGLYFIYSQLFYSDYYDVSGYVIYRNSEAVLQCITTSVSTDRLIKSNTCYTGGVVKCEMGDVVSIKTIESDRHVTLESSKTFFGMFKIGDIPEK